MKTAYHAWIQTESIRSFKIYAMRFHGIHYPFFLFFSSAVLFDKSWHLSGYFDGSSAEIMTNLHFPT